MSLTESVTASLALPPAPALFGSMGTAEAEELPLLDDSAPPTGDGLQLYPFQAEGVRFLMEHPSALLGDEMGLGKSIQAIVALQRLLHGSEVRRALILCPKTILFDWYYKLRLWAPELRIIPVEGPKRRRAWYWQSPAHINLAGYETWREDLSQRLADPAAFDLVILDEVQRIKNADTATHKAVSRLETTWRWGLSGTPLENQVEDLVAIFAYLKPGLLPSARSYPQGLLRRTIAPYVLRRRKADVLQLPPKESRTVWLELTPVQRIAYAAAEHGAVSALKQAGSTQAPMIALALLNRLKQICNLDESTGESCKMAFLDNELERLPSDDAKALIFSQYPEKTLRPLLPRLRRHSAELFDGSLSDWNRQLLFHRFQHADQPRVLAMSLKCGGVGITLTRATRVYHYDHWWNPAAAAQAEDRAHRIGQQNPVSVTTLLTRGTVEERIAELLERKRELFRQIIEPLGEMEASEELDLPALLSGSELMQLIGAPH